MSHPAGASLRCGLGLLSLAYRFGAARVGEEVGLWIKGSRRGRQLHHSAIRRQRLVESLERDRSGPICLAGTRVRDPGQSSGTYDVCAKTFYSRSPLSNYGAISKARPGPRAERSPGLRPCRLARGIPHFPPQLKSAATRGPEYAERCRTFRRRFLDYSDQFAPLLPFPVWRRAGIDRNRHAL